MFRISEHSTPFQLRPLGECVEVLDRLRKPINADERRRRPGKIPYFGANGQVGSIDEWIFDEDLVLVAEDGGFFEDPHRPISYRISGKSWVNNHAHVLRPHNGLDIEWLNYSICFQDIRHLIKGATLKKLNQADLAKIRIPYPPLMEQHRIVARIKDCMERVDEIEKLRNEAAIEAGATLPAVLNEAFVELAQSHEALALANVAIETRYGTSRKCREQPIGVVVLRIPNVIGGFVNHDDLKYCELDDAELTRLALKDGDLLFVRTNGSRDLVGRCAIYQHNGTRCAFASYLIRVRLDQKRVLPHYAAFFLNSSRGRAEIDQRRRTSAGQYNINSENLRSIEFPVPPLSVQREVVETLQDRQAVILQLQKELGVVQAEASYLREAILRKAFAGEL